MIQGILSDDVFVDVCVYTALPDCCLAHKWHPASDLENVPGSISDTHCQGRVPFAVHERLQGADNGGRTTDRATVRRFLFTRICRG